MPDLTLSDRSFLEQNQQEFAELLTFIDFAQGLTIGFIEVNQEQNKAHLVTALKEQFADTDMRLEVFNFSREQGLRQLREAVMQRIERIETDKKLVLLIQGLEVSIGTDGVGAYPPILQDLNFMRDAYRQGVPHPLLFLLPDYAITRVSRYAPDFWAWKTGLFRFEASQQSVEQLKEEAFEQPLPRVASGENQAQIDQLKQLLMELNPSGKAIAAENVVMCGEICYKLGSAYLTQQQPEQAKHYLLQGLKVTAHQPESDLSQSLQRKLGNAYEQMRQFEQAVSTYEAALSVAQSLNQSERIATLLSDLGDVALARRQFEQARSHYQQALDIKIEFNDRYSQASTYHQLGNVAEELRDYEQARSHYQQALDIFIEFNDRYSQASTYHQLGRIAEELRDYEQARSHLLQALKILVEFNDEHSMSIALQSLARLYKATQDDSVLTDVAHCLSSTAEEVAQRFKTLNEPIAAVD